MKHNNVQRIRPAFSTICLLLILFSFTTLINADDAKSDIDILNQYISSQGYHDAILFDASNIKQYWTDNSVFSKDNLINVLLSSGQKESVPLKIQLMNVNESQDCKIDVITKSSQVRFSVTNGTAQMIAASSEEPSFIDYNISSATFHLEDISDNTFYLKFSSPIQEYILIQKIVLSFSQNKQSTLLSSPGRLTLTKESVNVVSGEVSDSFFVTGKQSKIHSKYNILVYNSTLESSVTVKNTGKTSTRVYIGYSTYNKNKNRLNSNNYPYKNSKEVFTVLSSEEGSNRIVIDSMPSTWKTKCYLALDAKEDLADVPNTSLLSETISEINQLPNNQAEIIMSKPLSKPIAKGTKVRVNGLNGGYIYTNSKVLQPGEEAHFSSKIQKDEKNLEYSSKAFSRGIYYVTPVILSYSEDSKEENTIQILDYSVSY